MKTSRKFEVIKGCFAPSFSPSASVSLDVNAGVVRGAT